MLALDFDQLFSIEKDGYKRASWHKVVSMVTDYGGIWIPLATLCGLMIAESILYFLCRWLICRSNLSLESVSSSVFGSFSPKRQSYYQSMISKKQIKWKQWIVFFLVWLQQTVSWLFGMFRRLIYLYCTDGRQYLRKIVQCIIVCFAVYLFIEIQVLREPRTSQRPTGRVLPSLCDTEHIHKQTSLSYFRDTYFENYKLIHMQEEQKIRQQKRLDAGRIVVFVASCDGLGNRFMGLLSAFLFAILTNRAFFVLWEPCGNTVSAQLSDLFDSPGFDWDFTWLTSELQLSAEWKVPHRLIFTQYCRPCPFWKPIQDMEPIACSSYEESFPENVVVFRATHWLGPAMQHNPHYRSIICQMFGSNPFPQLVNALLQPSKRVEEIMQPFRQLIEQSRRVIGLQIRLRDSYAIDAYSEEVMWRCAQNILSHWDQVVSPASFISRNDSLSAVDRWFIVTDTPAARERLKQQLGDRLISMDPPIDKGKTESAQWALAEMWLLGETDEIIISPYSSFGLFGHGRTNKAPWTVDRQARCWKSPNPAPCDFYWFGVQRLKCFRDEWMTADMVNNDNCFG
eukprot:jgi/Galph1/2341/GphlegSOOS_G992.1